MPDNDDAGEQHALQVARSLLPVAQAVKIVRLPGLPPKGDVSDWLDQGHTKEELTEIVKGTPILKLEDFADTESTKKNGAILSQLSDVTPQPVRWLWRGRIPLGKVTVLDGDPGLGKSLLSSDIAARISTARTMPDGSQSDLSEPAGVVILSAEDDLADTIRPRLAAAGADLSRIVALTGVNAGDETRLPMLSDLGEIKEAIRHVNAKLVVIDPLMAYLPGKVDSHRDQDIRRSLAPLAALAAETGVAVLTIRHLNKTEGKNALYRGGGSIGIIGAARSGLLVAKDPEDEDKRILAVTKSNLAKTPPALAYHVVVTPTEVPYLLWGGTTDHTAATLLAGQAASNEDRSALEEAKGFLDEALADGPHPAKEVKQDAEQAGIAEHTLRRARAALGIKPSKGGRPGEKNQQWFWSLPPKMPKNAKMPTKKTWASSRKMGTFGKQTTQRCSEMTVHELLTNLYRQGFNLAPRPGGLLEVKPASRLTPELREELKRRKAEILALITSQARSFLSRPLGEEDNPDPWDAWAPFFDWLQEHSPERFTAICAAEEAIRTLEQQGITEGQEYEEACAHLLWHFEEARRLRMSESVRVWIQ